MAIRVRAQVDGNSMGEDRGHTSSSSFIATGEEGGPRDLVQKACTPIMLDRLEYWVGFYGLREEAKFLREGF